MNDDEAAQEIYKAVLPTVEKSINGLVARKKDPLSVAFAVFHSSAGKVLESLAVHFSEAGEVLAAGDRAMTFVGPRKLLCEHFEKAANQPGSFSSASHDKVLLFVQVGARVFFWPLDFAADPAPAGTKPS